MIDFIWRSIFGPPRKDSAQLDFAYSELERIALNLELDRLLKKSLAKEDGRDIGQLSDSDFDMPTFE